MNIFLKEYYYYLFDQKVYFKGKYEKGGKVVIHVLFHKWMILIVCWLT